MRFPRKLKNLDFQENKKNVRFPRKFQNFEISRRLKNWDLNKENCAIIIAQF